MLKTCQIIADTSMIRQFHEFFNLNFGGFFENWPNCVVSTHILPICRLHTVHYVTMNTVTDHFATRGKVLIPQAWLLQSLAPPVVQLYLGSLSNWLEEIKLAAVHICRKPACLPGRGASSRRQPPPSPPRADEVHAAFRRSAIIAGIPYVTRASDRCFRGSHCRRPTSKCAKS